MEASENPSDLSPASDGGAAPAPRSAGRRALPVLAVVAAGLVAGGGIGVFAAGPLLAKRLGAPPHAARDTTAAPEHGDGKAEKSAPTSLHVVDNLVLNPAQSGGTRFLMITTTFELKDAAAEESMKERDAEIRDTLLALFGRKTVEELTDITRREGIKQEVIAAVATRFPKGTVKRVFFPQFVIQ